MKKKTIDLQDISILNILTDHAELNNKELSGVIGLSAGPTLVRMQNLWEKGVIRSYEANINYQLFGYSKFSLFRVEVLDNGADELKERFLMSRFIIIFIEIEASVDFIMRIYLAVCLTKNQKAAREMVKSLTEGIKGIRSVTFNPIDFIAQKVLHLTDQDVIK
jgi:DNA-binding Lrp family transcriptional regulator